MFPSLYVLYTFRLAPQKKGHHAVFMSHTLRRTGTGRNCVDGELALVPDCANSYGTRNPSIHWRRGDPRTFAQSPRLAPYTNIPESITEGALHRREQMRGKEE